MKISWDCYSQHMENKKCTQKKVAEFLRICSLQRLEVIKHLLDILRASAATLRLIFSDGPCTCQPASPSTECCRTLDEAALALKTASLRSSFHTVIREWTRKWIFLSPVHWFMKSIRASELINATGQGVNSAVV